MAQFEQFDYTKLPKYKVELHVHLDGAVRLTTIWELAQKKGIKLKADTLEDFYDSCRIKSPSTLKNFLKPFATIIPVIADDPEALERIAFEFCEDAAKQKVLYCEVRYCPHLLTTCYERPTEFQESAPRIEATRNPKMTLLKARDVVMCINKGLSRGSAAFKITVKSILCCFRGRPEWSDEILRLCEEFKHQGVVGIDIAGDEAMEFASRTDIDVFRRAYELGIHRTVHAGEAGPASNVKIAIEEMFTDRIGHGYHVVDDDDIYRDSKNRGMHFEICPHSSWLTGSVSLGCSKHPIVKFAEDEVSFSINRDDPALIQKTLDEEYQFLRDFGLKDVHFARANFNAAMHSFLPEDEKAILLQKLKEVYGIPADAIRQTETFDYSKKTLAGLEASWY